MTIPITTSVLEEWQAKEYGSWEDHGSPDTGHVYPILVRYRTRLRWDNADELQLLLDSAGYHRNAWDPETAPWMDAMDRIYRKLQAAQPPRFSEEEKKTLRTYNDILTQVFIGPKKGGRHGR